jgi:hypothetical protein
MLNGAAASRGTDGVIEVVLSLDPFREPYLRDHQLDGKPVLPMAVACELMAEVALKSAPGLEVIAMRDLRVLQGIVLDNGPQTVRIVARPRAVAPGNAVQIEVSITGIENGHRAYYRAVAELAPALPQPPSIQVPSFQEWDPLPVSVEDAYRRWLFHGPLFQGVRAVNGVTSDGIAGWLAPSSTRELLGGDPKGTWMIDPVVIDSGLQLVLMWSRMRWDMSTLPSGFRTYRRFGSLLGSQIECRVRIWGASPIIHADLVFISGEGQVLGVLEDMEGACSTSMNRMFEGRRRQDSRR